MQGVELQQPGSYSESATQKSICSCLVCKTHYGQHILLDILTTSWPFVEFRNVLKTPYSGKCNGRLRIYMRRCLAALVFKLDDWNQMQFCRHILLNISTTSCPFLKFESVLESMHSGECDCLLRSWWRRILAISISSWMTGARCISANMLQLLCNRDNSTCSNLTTQLAAQMAC